VALTKSKVRIAIGVQDGFSAAVGGSVTKFQACLADTELDPVGTEYWTAVLANPFFAQRLQAGGNCAAGGVGMQLVL